MRMLLMLETSESHANSNLALIKEVVELDEHDPARLRKHLQSKISEDEVLNDFLDRSRFSGLQMLLLTSLS